MPSGMKNINSRTERGNGGPIACCDESMIRFIAKDKGNLELINIKILCEVFDSVYSYEVFIGNESYIKYTYDRKTKEYNFED